jgi:hypothetical protein
MSLGNGSLSRANCTGSTRPLRLLRRRGAAVLQDAAALAEARAALAEAKAQVSLFEQRLSDVKVTLEEARSQRDAWQQPPCCRER